MNTTRMVIVADDPLARAGLAALLADHVSKQVADQAEADGAITVIAGQIAPPERAVEDMAQDSARDFARDLAVYRPDVLVWDVGWDATADALPDWDDYGQPVIALVADETLAGPIQAAGARGILRRDTSPTQIIAAVGAVTAGLIVLDPAFALPHLAMSQTMYDGAALPDAPDLTPRELDVLRLLAEGLANRAIAQALDISEHTVKFHLNAILGKLAAQSRTEAVVNAIRLGVITV